MKKHKKIMPSKIYFLVAFDFAKIYTQTIFKRFTSENIKDEYYKNHPKPDDPRVWGGVFSQLSKDGLIIFQDYQKYKSRSGHGRPSSVWISREYSKQQTENRKLKTKPADQQVSITFEDGEKGRI